MASFRDVPMRMVFPAWVVRCSVGRDVVLSNPCAGFELDPPEGPRLPAPHSPPVPPLTRRDDHPRVACFRPRCPNVASRFWVLKDVARLIEGPPPAPGEAYCFLHEPMSGRSLWEWREVPFPEWIAREIHCS